MPDVLWRALPRALLDALSLPAYGMLCQVVTLVVGLLAARLALRRPWEALGVVRPCGWDAAVASLIAPLVFVVASFVALKIAEPYLLAELATEGAGASRRNAGAFGKAVTQAPLVLTLAWGALLAAVAEELAFRGALFGAVERTTLAFAHPPDVRSSESRPLVQVERAARRTRAEWWAGALAVVVAAAVFGAMHADMKGSVGIVRVVSTTCLGLACGSARLLGRSVAIPMLLHFTYNSVSLGLGRGLFRSESAPLVSVVPNLLLVVAAVGAAGAAAIIFARRVYGRTA